MATKFSVGKYAKTLRSSLSLHPIRFFFVVLLVFFLLYQPESPVPASAQSSVVYSPQTNVLASDPPGGTVPFTVTVPVSMTGAPFYTPRVLNIPPNFSISVYARVSNARFLAVTPSGDLLVSTPGSGSVKIIRQNSTAAGDVSVTTFVSGLSSPHDMVFQSVGGTTYFYVSETNQIDRYTYTYGATTPSNKVALITGLPDANSVGSYNHVLKNFAIGPDGKIYVSIGSRSNANPSEDPLTSNPVRGSIYRYNADGTGATLFARGLRNAEGVAFVPGTNNLWVAVNNRDDIACPNNGQTKDGCSPSNVGSIQQSYVDNHPPEEFTRVVQNGNYGWPYCNPNPDSPSGMNNMPFDRDQQNNPNNNNPNCDASANQVTRISKGIQAHSAPLGLTFLQNTAFPALYRNGAVIGLHGSWNSSEPHGYKVIYFPWDSATQTPGNQVDLITGWSVGNGDYWGRPVDTAVGLDGSMFISDDNSGTIYKMTYNPPTNSYQTTNVTKKTDDGTQGTFSYALNNTGSGGTITFDPSLNVANWTAPIQLSASATLPALKTGVTLNGGSCMGGPRITIDGTGVSGSGLTMNGGSTLMNIRIQKFSLRQLITNRTNGTNHLGTCVVAKE